MHDEIYSFKTPFKTTDQITNLDTTKKASKLFAIKTYRPLIGQRHGSVNQKSDKVFHLWNKSETRLVVGTNSELIRAPQIRI